MKGCVRTAGFRLPLFTPLSPEAVQAMNQEQRRSLLLELAILAQQVAAAQGVVGGLLQVESDEPLWNAQQAARCLGVSTDTVRTHGAAWGIEVDLPGTDLHRYNPRLVRARQELLRQPAGTGEHGSLTVLLPEA